MDNQYLQVKQTNDQKPYHQSHAHQKKKIDHYLNFRQALLCSMAFLGLYVAIYSAQNIQSVVFEKDGYGNLGFYSNAVAYLAQGTGSVFCVFIQKKIGDARSMAYSSCLCIPFIICLILPALKSENLDDQRWVFSNGFVYTIILITSFSNGFGEGIAQPASGKYIADCATEKTKGFFFAFFWAFYMGSQVFGNLIAAFVLGELDQKYYVLVMAIIGIAAGFLLFFLKEPIIQHEIHHANADDDHNIETGLISDAKRSQLSQRDDNVTLGQVIKNMWILARDPRFLYLVPQLFWTGVSIAYYSGNLVEMMQDAIGGDDDHYQFKLSMLAMVMFGFGEILGCFFIGYVVDKYGSKMAVICNLIVMTIMGAFTFAFIITY